MPLKTKILYITSGDNTSDHFKNSIEAAGYSCATGTYNELATKLSPSANYQIIVFNAGNVISEAQLSTFFKLAEKIKSNQQTSQIRLFCVGIPINLMQKIQNHHFDDLMFGQIRIPALLSRLKTQTRLTIIESEINRRNQLTDLFGTDPKISIPTAEIVKNAAILITGRPNGYLTLEQTLSHAAILVGALSLTTAMEYLIREKFDMIIINGGRQPTRFLTFIEEVRKNPALYNLPILMVTHKTNLAESHIAYETGLTDIIEAPLNQNELLLRTNCLIREYHWRCAISKIYRESRHIPTNDALTGFYTFGFFQAHLQETINDHQKDRSCFSLITLTIDNLQSINHEFGALAGDRLLRQVADILMNIIRSEDLPGRISGRSFGLTLPGTTQNEATHLLNRIEALLQHTKFICETNGQAMSVEFSAEIIESNGSTSAESLINIHKQKHNLTNTIIAA